MYFTRSLLHNVKCICFILTYGFSIPQGIKKKKKKKKNGSVTGHKSGTFAQLVRMLIPTEL